MAATNIFTVLDDDQPSDINNDYDYDSIDDWKVVKAKKLKSRFQEEQYSNKFDKKFKKEYNIYNEKNKKKILCNNVLNFGKCNYNDKCLYAHSYEEQNIEPLRKQLYDKVKSYDQWPVDLSKDEKLGRNLLLFTKICHDCEKKKCPGGYNCKYGVMDKKYQICYKDLVYGSCDNAHCDLIHLTDRGVKPSHPIKKPSHNISQQIPEGKLLTNDFFLVKSKHEEYDSDSDSETSIEQIQEFLNKHDDIDPCDKSIFL
jgi:hypothetical protein